MSGQITTILQYFTGLFDLIPTLIYLTDYDEHEIRQNGVDIESTIAVLLAAAASSGAQAADQAPLQDGSSSLDPQATASIKSIFDSFGPPSGGNARLKLVAVTACCGEGCPIGLCNGRPADSFKPSSTTGIAASGLRLPLVLVLRIQAFEFWISHPRRQPAVRARAPTATAG